MPYKFIKAYSQYGASMGRRNNTTERDTVTKLHLQRVPINQGGYDPGGAYWGTGAPLYVAYGYGSEELQEYFFRAADRDEAKAIVKSRFPNAKFYR